MSNKKFYFNTISTNTLNSIFNLIQVFFYSQERQQRWLFTQNLHYEISSNYSIVSREVILSNLSVLCFGRIGYAFAPGSFLFSLRNHDNLGPFKAPLKDDNNRRAIIRDNSRGPTFDADLYIVDNVRITGNSWAKFGASYQLPPGYIVGEPNAISLLAGNKRFIPSEIEVLYLN